MPRQTAIDANLDFFFRRPEIGPTVPGWQSTLYLARREVQDCLIGTAIAERRVLQRRRRHRLFASAMVIFAGVDLLAKFAAPTSRGRIGDRFVDFVKTYAVTDGGRRVTRREARKLWAFRNALVHSFGLYSATRSGRRVRLKVIQQNEPGSAIYCVGRTWYLSIDDLFELFVLAIEGYERALRQPSRRALRQRFSTAFRRYGRVFHGGPGLSPRPRRRPLPE